MGSTDDFDDELEATGYHYTHWDCPACGYDNVHEGDVKGELVECEDCGREILIR